MTIELNNSDKKTILRGLAQGVFPASELCHITGVEIGKLTGKFIHFPELTEMVPIRSGWKRELLKSVINGVLNVEAVPGLLEELTSLNFWWEVLKYEKG